MLNTWKSNISKTILLHVFNMFSAYWIKHISDIEKILNNQVLRKILPDNPLDLNIKRFYFK